MVTDDLTQRAAPYSHYIILYMSHKRLVYQILYDLLDRICLKVP